MKNKLLNNTIIYIILSFTFQLLVVASTNIKQDISETEKEIQIATKKSQEYDEGLIKQLIDVRIELLKINKTILEGKNVSKQENIDLKNKDELLDQILQEMLTISQEIENKKQESSKYSGGLVKVMLESTIATLENNLAMLKGKYFQLKYNIYWVPYSYNKKNNINSVKKNLLPEQKIKEANIVNEKHSSILTPQIINKTFQPTDASRNIYNSSIWFDIEWDTSKIEKPIRAVKGIMIFTDLFDEEKFKIKWTINSELTKDKNFIEKSTGFKVNRFQDSHMWMKQTNIKDMKVRYKIQSIIFADGSKKDY